MPFVSQAQQGWAHAHPEEFGKKNLAEFDAATKGKHDLPQHVHNGKPSYSIAHAARKKQQEQS
jgi:hypothetical protein